MRDGFIELVLFKTKGRLDRVCSIKFPFKDSRSCRQAKPLSAHGSASDRMALNIVWVFLLKFECTPKKKQANTILDAIIVFVFQ